MTPLHLLAGIFGVVSHQYYFRPGEHHLYPLKYLQWYTFALILTITSLSVGTDKSLSDSAKSTAGWMLAYFIGLYASLVFYRLLFHPLGKIPGPYGARLSGLWFSYSLRNMPAFRRLEALHSQYGPVVRVGPSDVSVTHPEAVDIIYGYQSRCSKNAFYDNAHPMASLHSYRSRAAHDKRRRIWSTGFGDKAMRGYETRVRRYQEMLFAGLDGVAGQVINVSQWFGFYTYDVMGDLAFGRTFDMLESSANHWAIRVLENGITPFKYYPPSWVFRCLVTLPFLSKDWHRFIEFTTQKMVHRMNNKVEIPDICASFLAPLNGRTLTADEFNLLMGDSMLIITAGSDTTATALTSVVYELACRPEEVEKLRAELLPIKPDASGEYLHDHISQLSHLNGFINETLRLHPPLPSVIPRKTPPEGIHVGGTYIAGGMTVFSPQWLIGRSDKAFANPLSFLPQRWCKSSTLIENRSANAPFLTGPYSCIGKPLALMNIRTTIARLIMRYDIGFPAGETGAPFMEHAEDHFSMGIQRMPIVLRRRCQ